MTGILVEPTWVGRPPAPGETLLVLAPHPDDEVLGAAGLMRWCASLGLPIEILAVTDGERSHARSARITPDDLRERRAMERTAALEVLGLTPDVSRLELPDGEVSAHEHALTLAIADRAGPTTTLIAPWRSDGHPDHEAVGRAAWIAAERTGARLWEIPIWAKVHGTVRPDASPARSHLVLDDATRANKAEAVRCFTTQLVPLGPHPLDGPVVHPHEVAALLDGQEQVLWR